MAYKRVQAVPNLMIDYQAFVLFNHLSPEEKDIVSNAIMDYVIVARKRDSAYIIPFLKDGVSSMAREAFDGMIESIDEGIEGYWQMCDKLARNRSKGATDNSTTTSRPQVDNSTTTSRQEDDINKYVSKDVSMEVGKDVGNNLQYPSYFQQVMKSDKANEFLIIVKQLNNNGFNLSDEQIEDIARRMKFDELDGESAKNAIDICKKNNKIDLGYFINCAKNECVNGWNNRVS